MNRKLIDEVIVWGSRALIVGGFVSFAATLVHQTECVSWPIAYGHAVLGAAGCLLFAVLTVLIVGAAVGEFRR